MRVRLHAAVLAAALVACGPPPPPQYIADVQAIASGPAARGAPEKSPELWKQATEALDGAIAAHRAGNEERARSLAMEASILMKTAIAVARQKGAAARIASAEDRIAEALKELERFRSLRIDSQARFLELTAFHESQKQTAKSSLAAFKKDQEKLATMTEDQRALWLAVELERIERVLQGARAALLAAQTLGCESLLPSETKETREALGKAEKARGGGWETLRPLGDDAALRAERLLAHTRVMHKPDPLANPAVDDALVERFVMALSDTKVMVSATTRGILLSIRNPTGPSGGLSKEASAALEAILAATGGKKDAVVLVEAYRLEGCQAKGCLAETDEAAGLAAGILVAGGLEKSAVISKGWGESPPSEPGHCIAETCPHGRLDVVIVNM